MPRNPKATRPKANTAGAIMRLARPYVLTMYEIDMRTTMLAPSQ